MIYGKCITCQHYEPYGLCHDGNDYGFCNKFDELTRKSDWCAKWKKAEDEEVKENTAGQAVDDGKE